MMNNGALSLGSPNTPITKWSDVAQTASFLKDLGVNEGENYAVMDPGLHSDLLMRRLVCMLQINWFVLHGRMRRSQPILAAFAH